MSLEATNLCFQIKITEAELMEICWQRAKIQEMHGNVYPCDKNIDILLIKMKLLTDKLLR